MAFDVYQSQAALRFFAEPSNYLDGDFNEFGDFVPFDPPVILPINYGPLAATKSTEIYLPYDSTNQPSPNCVFSGSGTQYPIAMDRMQMFDFINTAKTMSFEFTMTWRDDWTGAESGTAILTNSEIDDPTDPNKAHRRGRLSASFGPSGMVLRNDSAATTKHRIYYPYGITNPDVPDALATSVAIYLSFFDGWSNFSSAANGYSRFRKCLYDQTENKYFPRIVFDAYITGRNDLPNSDPTRLLARNYVLNDNYSACGTLDLGALGSCPLYTVENPASSFMDFTAAVATTF